MSELSASPAPANETSDHQSAAANGHSGSNLSVSVNLERAFSADCGTAVSPEDYGYGYARRSDSARDCGGTIAPGCVGTDFCAESGYGDDLDYVDDRCCGGVQDYGGARDCGDGRDYGDSPGCGYDGLDFDDVPPTVW